MKLRILAVLLAIAFLVAAAPSEAGTRTPAMSSVSASGTVPTGARSVTFILSSDFAGTILGATVSGATDTFFNFAVCGNDETLTAIAYTRSAGSLRIIEIR